MALKIKIKKNKEAQKANDKYLKGLEEHKANYCPYQIQYISIKNTETDGYTMHKPGGNPMTLPKIQLVRAFLDKQESLLKSD